MPENILSCHHHDYLEAACTLFYRLSVTTDSDIVVGVAKDLSTQNKQEFLHLKTDSGAIKINIMDIVSIQVLTPNAQFSDVVFKAS